MTTHYHFHALDFAERDVRLALETVENLHARASDLPFHSVGEIVELEGEAASFDLCPHDDPNLMMLIQCGDLAMRDEFMPKHLIGFGAHPAPGCEMAYFGLAYYDKYSFLNHKVDEETENVWAWNSWCSTRHAANPDFGGWSNFIRGFSCIINMLDYTKQLGIVQHVRDDYKYWEQRNIELTLHTVASSLAYQAAFAGALGDALDGFYTVDDPIKDHPNFEHLEHQGRQNPEDEK